MRTLFAFFVLILTITLPNFAQTGTLRIEKVSEPPELTGEPKKITKPSEADNAILEIIGHLKDPPETKSTLPKLDEFIKQYPDYSDAYFLRATCNACILENRDFASISADVRAAMSHPNPNVYNKTDYYSLLAKISLVKANYQQAVDELETAMRRDLSTADKMFNVEDVEPQRTSKFCIWNLTDLDVLVTHFPKDYRIYLFRGLYFKFFTTFKEGYYPKALQEFQKAALLNPKSPLPQYFIGELHSKASFWTKKAWASDEGRDNEIRSAVQAYSNAIQLDSTFLPAYENRASGYLNLKDYSLSIRDFDKVIDLDPENRTAYSDRGIAKLESSQYMSATFDFGEAIRRKSEDDSFLPKLYEYRGDAHLKLGMYLEAIADYSKAIERRLANDSFVLSLKQIRALYPEYDAVSDEVLCRKLNALFWPQFDYKVFAEQLMEKNGKWQVSLLNELYEKRGDAYLKAGDFRRGVLDFKRIFKGIPNFANSTDRWRALGTTSEAEEYLLDTRSAEFDVNMPAKLWIKMVGKKGSRTIAYEVDCKAKRLREASTISYDAEGKLLSSSEVSRGWYQVVPDSIGEQLYNGACSIGW